MPGIIKRDPFYSLFSYPRWMDEFDESSASQRGLKIHETNEDIVAEAVVAGVSADDVSVEIDNGVITIKAEASKENKTKNEYMSSSYQYYYTCALSGGEWDKATADVKNGVVVITIPKAKAARKITLKARENK